MISKLCAENLGLERLTLDLLKSFALKFAHAFALFVQEGNAPVERVCNAQIIAIELILAIGPFVAQRGFHLLNGCDKALGFSCHLIFLSGGGLC